MNSRQRRGVILLIVAVIGALAVFGGVLAVVSDVESKVGPEVRAYRLAEDVSAYTEIDESMLEEVTLPRRWLPPTALTDSGDLVGKVAAAQLTKGSLLQAGMVAERPALQPGQREIAIMIDAETGVAGKINPGATVDIFATFPSEEGRPAVSRVIVAGARVVDVGEIAALDRDEEESNRVSEEAVPITFALSVLDAQRIAYAESFATHVRLAIVAPGSDTSIDPKEQTYTLENDKGAASGGKQ